MAKATWTDFERSASNIKNDFEDMCRVFFNIKFFDGKAIFSQSPNNAGVEIAPIEYEKQFISFQSKHFDNTVSYAQIKNSIERTVKHYNSSQLSAIYLLCNKDLDLTCQSFLDIQQIVASAGMSLILICNNAILDEVSTNDSFHNIKCCFFGGLKLDKSWFDDKLKISLEDLGGRYDKDFNVDIPLQRHFEFIFESSKMAEIMQEFLVELKKDYENIYSLDSEIKKELCTAISQLEVPIAKSIRDIFKWKDGFVEIKAKIEKLAKELSEKKDNAKIESVELRNKSAAYFKTEKLIEQSQFSDISVFMHFDKNGKLVKEGKLVGDRNDRVGKPKKVAEN